MNDFSDFERAQQIDRYLAGRLSTAETQQMKTALQQDPEWQQAYEDAKLSRLLAQEHGLRDEIRSIRTAMLDEGASEATIEPMTGTPMAFSADTTVVADTAGRPSDPVQHPLVDTAPVDTAPVDTAARPSDSTKPKAKVRPMFSAYAGRIAAGLALLLVGFLGFQYATLSGDDLYAERATTYQMSASRSSETPTDSPEEQLEKSYRAQRFSEATAAYEQIENPSITVMFLAGNAYLKQDKTVQAIGAFREIVRINGSQGVNRFEEDAQYYLALSYLKADRTDEALPLLEKINDNPQHSYHALVGDYYLWKVRFLNSIR